ncbi:unnamed protein product [Linum tenue]|uniref:BZIP domain-containing protein n=1 Tax=Linum tenue TaxID=586396 RepID=A0AAV0GQT2_9ROSI|nr:unnamed protein product [Linum tenue]
MNFQGTSCASMANSKGSTNIRNLMYTGKQSLLPPKIPFPGMAPTYVEYIPSNVVGSKAVQKPREGSTFHQRTSSETFLIEDQPSWLDDLLNEPETPVRRGGHRRSSSDSFAYVDVTNNSNVDYVAYDDYRYKNMTSVPFWGSQEFDYLKDARQGSFYVEGNMSKQKNMGRDLYMNPASRSSGVSSVRENVASQNSGSSCARQEPDGSSAGEKQEIVESGPHDSKPSSERKDGPHAKPSASEGDTKRAKQQYAQRSRVRKLQYIAELERNVQALQAKGSDVSAELEFLNQQNLILSMENKALKQRLESIAQEQLIKHLEQEVLEREIGRLRALYQQQQMPPPIQQRQPSSSHHRRTNSRDLESQFGNLSLKHKDSGSGRDSITGPVRI